MISHLYRVPGHPYSTRNLETADSMHSSSSSILSYLDEKRQEQGTSSRALRRRNSHLSAIEPIFDEKKIQELLDLVGSINVIQTANNDEKA